MWWYSEWPEDYWHSHHADQLCGGEKDDEDWKGGEQVMMIISYDGDDNDDGDDGVICRRTSGIAMERPWSTPSPSTHRTMRPQHHHSASVSLPPTTSLLSWNDLMPSPLATSPTTPVWKEESYPSRVWAIWKQHPSRSSNQPTTAW